MKAAADSSVTFGKKKKKMKLGANVMFQCAV